MVISCCDPIWATFCSCSGQIHRNRVKCIITFMYYGGVILLVYFVQSVKKVIALTELLRLVSSKDRAWLVINFRDRA